MPKSRRDRTIALTRTSKKQGIEHKEKVSSKNKSRPYLGFLIKLKPYSLDYWTSANTVWHIRKMFRLLARQYKK